MIFNYYSFLNISYLKFIIMSEKIDNAELRIILIGESGVGKKSIVKRFKILNCSETREIKKKKNKSKENKNENENKKSKIRNNNNINININSINKNETKTNTNTRSENEEISREETEQKKYEMRKEEKRIELMNFTKIYKINMNNLEINFFPCIEAQPLPYDYELREDDEFYEYEKEYKLTIKPLIKELENIILRPSENSSNQIEFLFLFCFDLSDINSFETLYIYFSQIEKHFKLSSNFKIVLIGNKMDKKVSMSNEQKEEIDHLIAQINTKYYEISSLMFFPMDKFFENLILDNFSNLPILSSEESKKYFHEILTQKKSFTKAKRETFEFNDVPCSNKYNINPYEYPEKRREFLRIFHDTDKFNKKIFINKTGVLFPPIKKEKDKEYSSKGKTISKKKEIYSFEANKKVQEAIELNSRKPGYSLGSQTFKPLNLKQQRKLLSESRDNEFEKYLTEEETTIIHQQIKPTNKGEISQERYAKNRLEQQKKVNDDIKKIKDDIKRRHDEMNMKNSNAINEKIESVIEKDEKYQKKYIDRERRRIRMQKKSIIKNNLEREIPKRFDEPKGKFYTPISSISNNRGFTFGLKLNKTIEKQDSPEFPLFKDDFEKLVLKNQKTNFIKPISKRFPDYKTDEVGDSSYLMEAQKKFEINRNLVKKNKILGFLQDRRSKREDVKQKKKEITEAQENELKEQILKQYKTDSNYLIREINYNQVENASPKYTMKEKYNFGSIFQHDKQMGDDSSNQFGYSTLFNPDISTKFSTLNLENPDFSLIRPKYPIYSFSKSKRFDLTMNNFDNNKNKLKYSNTETNFPFSKEQNYFDYKYTQSFLKAQTSMGTSKKLFSKDNGVPGPDYYNLRRFADEVVKRGNEINLSRIKVRENEKLEQKDKEMRAKLREQWQEDKKYLIKMSVKESLINSNKINNNNEQLTDGNNNNSFKDNGTLTL